MDLKFTIKSNIPKYVKDEFESGNFQQQVLDVIEAESYEELDRLARESMSPAMYQEYMDSVSTKQTHTSVVLRLDGTLANIQEQGAKKYDMKPGLLNGKEYVDIPLEHSSPKSGGPSPVPQKIGKEIKKQNIMRYGDRFTDTSRRKTNKATGYKHESPMYDGLTKNKSKYARSSGADFVTFRRISKNSDPRSWWHPEVHALHLVEKVGEYIEDIYDDVVNQIYKKSSK